MIHLSWHEIKNLIDAVERARSYMGRGFFWYYLHLDGILVRDPGLTDTGYSNLAGYVRRHVDAKRWRVTPDGDNGFKIEAKED